MSEALPFKYPVFNVVLVAPEIPQNTGNIGRICVCSGCKLHLVKPLAFSLEDRYVKRAGMDYWKNVDCIVHENWEGLLNYASKAPMYFYSTKGYPAYWDCPMEDGAYLVFGSEGHGLPRSLHDDFPDKFYTIPMPGPYERSLNLANSVGIAVYEGLRRRISSSAKQATP